MSQTVVVKLKGFGLNKASCSCGWVKFATFDGGIFGLANRHSVSHEEVTTIHTEGDIRSGRRALAGRRDGNTHSNESDYDE